MSKEFPKPGGLEKTPKKLTNSFTNVSDVAKLLGPMVTKKINNSIDFLRHADETRFSWESLGKLGQFSGRASPETKLIPNKLQTFLHILA